VVSWPHLLKRGHEASQDATDCLGTPFGTNFHVEPVNCCAYSLVNLTQLMFQPPCTANSPGV
jgi:hypothetical protein